MGILSTILNLFGTKSQRDMKELSPVLKKILDFDSNLSSLSNDELRTKTTIFKSKINTAIESFDKKIETLKLNVEKEKDIDIQENFYKEIDELEKEKYKAIAQTLNSIKEEAFAVIKETAKRFNNNQEIIVTANSTDVDLSQKFDHVRIEGD